MLCEQFNKFVITLQKEKYPWFEPDNERRNMSNREILDKYVDIDKLFDRFEEEPDYVYAI